MSNAVAKKADADLAAPNGMPNAGSIMAVIERAASNPDVDIDKMERLMQMYERLAAKQAEAAFYEAFSDMQTEIPTITKKGEIKVSGEVRSRYARNEDIQPIIKPILKEHGFMLNFRNEYPDAGHITVWGILAHKAGHKIETPFLAGADTSGSKNDIQAFGSSQSYGQRYVTKSLLNIVEQGQDDDGNGAYERITDSQLADLEALMHEVDADKPKFLKYFKIGRIEDLPAEQFNTAIKALRKKAGQ